MALDPLTGLPSSNTQTVYAGDKPINVPATPTMPAVAPTAPVVTPNAPFSALTQTTPLQGSLTPKTPIVPPTGTYEQMAQSAYSQPQVETPEAALNRQLVGQYQQMLGLGTGQGVAEQKAAEQAALAQQYGTVETQNRINEIAKQFEANKLTTQGQQLGIQGKGYGVENVDTGSARFERENAVKNLSLASESLALQGKLDSANAAIKQAIDIKYGPQEAKLAAIKEFMTINQAELARQDAKALDKQKTLLAAKEKDLAETKKNETDMAEMITKAAPYAPADVIAKAKQAKSSVEVAVALGKYGGDYLGDLVKKSTIAKNNADYNKTIAEIKALQTPLPNLAPVGSNASSINNWVNSATNKESLSAGEREKIAKSFAVTGQLGALATALQKDQTSFFGGKVREIKAALGQDANAGAIQAQITALVPQVARGTFGEVGVLTDADISNYKKVIGNLSSPNDQNAAVTAMTLTALRNGVKSQLDTAAASKLDVSRFAPMYQDLTNQINTINDSIGVTDVQVRDYVNKNPSLRPMIEQLVLEGRKGSEILQILGVEN